MQYASRKGSSTRVTGRKKENDVGFQPIRAAHQRQSRSVVSRTGSQSNLEIFTHVDSKKDKNNNTALWSGSNKNQDVSTGPLARPFIRSLALPTLSLAPHYSLRWRAPLRSLVRSLAHFTHSLARGIRWLFFCVFFYSCP